MPGRLKLERLFPGAEMWAGGSQEGTQFLLTSFRLAQVGCTGQNNMVLEKRRQILSRCKDCQLSVARLLDRETCWQGRPSPWPCSPLLPP